ncbi:MAG: hypothetical protein M1813_000862 [Trichoglossum hirsutum]|nr:MAG: hypothetical protein M1813_000862 [Trichoglossum hirsutum]
MARRKIPPELFSILDENKRIEPSSVALEKPQPLAVAAALGDIRDKQSKVRIETGNIHSNIKTGSRRRRDPEY